MAKNMQSRCRPGLSFILVTVFLDTLGFGIVIPVLPALVATMTQDKQSQAYWYGLLLGSYGFAQFFSAPLLGAISDRYGRRTVLLVSIFGLGLNFLITAVSPWLWLLLLSRLIGGASGASFTVAGAYTADITPGDKRSRSFGLLGAVFGLGFICGPIMGGLLSTGGLRVPYFAAAGFSLLNWVYGFFVLPESLPSDRRSSPCLYSYSLSPINSSSDLGSVHDIPIRMGTSREWIITLCGRNSLRS